MKRCAPLPLRPRVLLCRPSHSVSWAGADDEFELPTAHCEDRKGPKAGEGVDARVTAADGYATATYVQDERQM